MTPRLLIVAAITGLLTAGGLAHANHTRPPDYVDAGPLTLSISTESKAGDIYHDRNTAGRAGTKCTASTTDDGTGDSTGECFNDRNQLKAKDVTAEEGTAANCRRVQDASAAPVTFDGVWFNRTPQGTVPDGCGDPTTGGAKGRVYTGMHLAGVGSLGVAGGGDLASGGCVQAFAEDDTSGNVISGTISQAQTAAGNAHSAVDDDTDAAVCFDY